MGLGAEVVLIELLFAEATGSVRALRQTSLRADRFSVASASNAGVL